MEGNLGKLFDCLCLFLSNGAAAAAAVATAIFATAIFATAIFATADMVTVEKAILLWESVDKTNNFTQQGVDFHRLLSETSPAAKLPSKTSRLRSRITCTHTCKHAHVPCVHTCMCMNTRTSHVHVHIHM